MTPGEIVEDYVTRVWNKRDPGAVSEYLADPCWRHDTGNPEKPFAEFTNADQMARLEEGYATGDFDFQTVQLLESGEFVTYIWNLSYKPANDAIKAGLAGRGAEFDDDGNVMVKGIEVFRVRDGKIVEIWVAQSSELKGHWGPTMSGD